MGNGPKGRQKGTGHDLKLPGAVTMVPTCWSHWASDDHLGVEFLGLTDAIRTPSKGILYALFGSSP